MCQLLRPGLSSSFDLSDIYFLALNILSMHIRVSSGSKLFRKKLRKNIQIYLRIPQIFSSNVFRANSVKQINVESGAKWENVMHLNCLPPVWFTDLNSSLIFNVHISDKFHIIWSLNKFLLLDKFNFARKRLHIVIDKYELYWVHNS